MHLILNEETNLMTDKEDFFLSTLYLFNMNFERPTELIIDLYKESIQTGAQIIIDIEFQWFEFTKPIEELQEVTEVLKQQLNILGEDKVLYLSQIKSLLEPFDINHYRWAENSSSLSYQTNLIDQSRRKNYNNNKNNKNIFYFSDRKSNIIDDCLLYSGVRRKYF